MLARTFGCVRLVWNRTLAERRRLYHGEGRGLSYAASDAALTVLKRDPDLAFLAEVSSVQRPVSCACEVPHGGSS